MYAYSLIISLSLSFFSSTPLIPLSFSSIVYFRIPQKNKIAVVVGTVTDDKRAEIPAGLKLCALRVTETVRNRIVAAGGEVLTFDQLALLRPTGANTLLLRGRRSARTANKYFGRPGTKGSTTRPKTCAPGRKNEVARGRRASKGFKV